MQMILAPKVQKPEKVDEKAENKDENKQSEPEKTQEETLEEKNKVDPFRVKVKKTYDFIKLKYL